MSFFLLNVDDFLSVNIKQFIYCCFSFLWRNMIEHSISDGFCFHLGCVVCKPLTFWTSTWTNSIFLELVFSGLKRKKKCHMLPVIITCLSSTLLYGSKKINKVHVGYNQLLGSVLCKTEKKYSKIAFYQSFQHYLETLR